MNKNTETDTNRKEYFRHKNTLLFNNDVLNNNLFDKEFIDLIVTSPPYNVGIEYNSNDDELSYEKYLEFSEKWMKNCYDWAKMQVPLEKL
ncbi:MAG: site-specific DNA-methyltransferase [Prevotellaceae bacterium]|jgi:site-specific DNA-methyltransferase (adenine-specific)|nr:site-specific DNA-methyltransferase [Prevotellaceae bacterium]